MGFWTRPIVPNRVNIGDFQCGTSPMGRPRAVPSALLVQANLSGRDKTARPPALVGLPPSSQLPPSSDFGATSRRNKVGAEMGEWVSGAREPVRTIDYIGFFWGPIREVTRDGAVM